MAWTLDSYRAESAWGHEKAVRRDDRDPMARFLVHVDGMLYVATAALVICLATLLAG